MTCALAGHRTGPSKFPSLRRARLASSALHGTIVG